MMRILLGLLAVVAVGEPNVTGTWQMDLQADHVVPTALVLKQAGTAVTGTIKLPGGRGGQRITIDLSGTLIDLKLSLSGAVEGGKESSTIELEATVKDNGSLEGTVTTRHGKFAWTAEKLKGQP